MAQDLKSQMFPQRNLVIKILIVLVLLGSSIQVLAGCRDAQAEGFSIFTICEANFNGQGQYVNSTCNMGPPPEASQTSMNMCMAQGAGCIGSACTWDGPLND
jgi:hypothetical protein